MAEYKRKRRGAFKSAPKMNKKRTNDKKIFDDIEMSSFEPKAKKDSKRNMRVVRGKKFDLKRRFKAIASTVAIILVVAIVCQLIMPAGIIETAENLIAQIGGGSYPISLESSDTVNLISKGSYYYLLTNNSVEGYSSAGKRIFSFNHGFENPIIKTSKTRALVFEQDGKEALIFTLKGLQSNVELKENIKTAAIGDDGTYAIVTTCANYAAQVNVYKKNGKSLYTWYSAKDLVNNVAVAPSGKKIAVSTFDSAVGNYNSKLLLLNFESATPENEKLYENTAIYALDTTFSGGFSVLTANEYNFVTWSKFKITSYKNEYNTAMFRAGNNGVAVVYNRDSDKTDNRIAVFSRNGKLKQELQFKGIISDFSVKNHHIYCVSDTKAYILDNDGSFLRSGECGFGIERICPLGQNGMALVSDNQIEKIKLE